MTDSEIMNLCKFFNDLRVSGDAQLGEQMDQLRSRLQALEQNTTPARPAEQKLSNYGPPISAPELWANALQAGASKKPRELWVERSSNPHLEWVVALQQKPNNRLDDFILFREVL